MSEDEAAPITDFDMAAQALVGVFRDIDLARFLPTDRRLRIGLLGASIPVEAWSLARYLRAERIEEMVAYDKDDAGEGFVRISGGVPSVNFRYITGDLRRADLLRGSYDLFVSRKPDVQGGQWEQIFDHAFGHLAPGGAVVVTVEEAEATQVRALLSGRGTIIVDEPIGARYKVLPYVVENRIVVANTK